MKLLDSSFELSLALGTGVGYIQDRVFLIRLEEQVVQSIVPAPLHSRLDFDFILTPQWAFSAFARVQVVEFAVSGGAMINLHLFEVLP